VVLSEFVAPAVTAALVSGAASYFVSKATARSMVDSARIAADVEREKLAHTRDAWRAALHQNDLDSASRIWREVRSAVLSGELS
jgi:hypothetical protein